MRVTLRLSWVHSRIIKIKEDLSEIMQDFKFDCEEWARPSHQPRRGFTLGLWGNLCSTLCFWSNVNVCKYTKACNSPGFRAFVFLNKKYCRNDLIFTVWFIILMIEKKHTKIFYIASTLFILSFSYYVNFNKTITGTCQDPTFNALNFCNEDFKKIRHVFPVLWGITV